MKTQFLKTDDSSSKKFVKRMAGASVAGLLLLMTAPAQAQIIWSGNGADNDFFNAQNWNFGTYSGQISVNQAIHSNLLAENASVIANASIVAGAGYTFTFRNSQINSEESVGGFFRGQGNGTDQTYARSIYSFTNTTAYLERIGVTTALHLDGDSAVYFTATSTIPVNANSVVYLAPGATITFLGGITTAARFETLADRIINTATGETLTSNSALFAQTGSWSTAGFSIRAIPEPGSAILLLTSAGGMALLARRGRKRL